MARECSDHTREIRKGSKAKQRSNGPRVDETRVAQLVAQLSILLHWSYLYPKLKYLECHYRRVRINISENISCELHDWHPTPCRDLNHANDHYIATFDSTLSDPPLITSRIETLGVRLASLVGENESQFPYCSHSEEARP